MPQSNKSQYTFELLRFKSCFSRPLHTSHLYLLLFNANPVLLGVEV